MNGAELPGVMNSAEMKSLTGAALATRTIDMHPSGLRHATVAESGIVWYLDEPEGHVSHFLLAMVPSDTPEKPSVGYCGSVELDGWKLTENCTEATLLKRCQWQLEGHNHSWSYRTPHHYVSFIFERRRSRTGRRAGTHKLSYVSFSFSNNKGEPGTPPNGGPAVAADNSGASSGPPSVN